MKTNLSIASVRLPAWLLPEDGQDIIEYALVVALIAFGATAAMSALASEVSHLFSSINFNLTV
jgi:pilus assembly protein Flp/PilA